MKKKSVWVIVGIVLLISDIAWLWPVKFAITQPKGENYIIGKYTRSTGVNFDIIDEQSGECVDDVWVEDLEPFYSDFWNYYLQMQSDNIFCLYGEFVGVSADGERIFRMEDWDIMYPVKRGLLNFFPFNWFLSNINMFY